MPLIPRPEYHTEYTRRLQWEKAVKERDHLRKQIEKLADYILSISPSGIPEGSAVDVAIKYIKEAAHWVRKLEEKNIELWETKMKAEKAHVELFDAHKRLWEELKSVERERDEAIAYGRSIVKELAIVKDKFTAIGLSRAQWRESFERVWGERDDIISQRDNLQQQRDYYQGSKDELITALKEAQLELDVSSSTYPHRWGIVKNIINSALAKADEL